MSEQQEEVTLPQVKRMRLVVIDQWSEHNLSCHVCQSGNEENCPESQRLRGILRAWSWRDMEMQWKAMEKQG